MDSRSVSVANVTPPSLSSSSGQRTASVGGGRWYDYGDSVLGYNLSLGVNALSATSMDLWWDTTAIFGYSDGTFSATTTQDYGSEFTSIGLNLHPWCPTWNLSSYFPATEIAITDLNAYSIDSVSIGAFYGRNASKPTVVDTLILQLVYGVITNTAVGGNTPQYLGYSNASMVGNYPGIGTGALLYVSMLFDSLDDRAGYSEGTLSAAPWWNPPTAMSTQTYKFLLTKDDTVTVSGGAGMLQRTYPRPGHVPADPPISLSVPAGNIVSSSISFRSGDGTLTHTFPHDTVDAEVSGTFTYKYDLFSPILVFAATSSGGSTAQFPPYNNNPFGIDWTSGYFDLEGARSGGPDREYVPNWGWTAGTGTASTLQYPDIWFYATCPTCVTVGTASLGVNNVVKENTVTAFPNPASAELNISYQLTQNTTIKANLSNMIGQVVATQNLENNNTGKVVFNTSNLPDGVYIYTLDGDGVHANGQIVIAH
jgi:hypothetical protein